MNCPFKEARFRQNYSQTSSSVWLWDRRSSSPPVVRVQTPPLPGDHRPRCFSSDTPPAAEMWEGATERASVGRRHPEPRLPRFHLPAATSRLRTDTRAWFWSHVTELSHTAYLTSHHRWIFPGRWLDLWLSDEDVRELSGRWNSYSCLLDLSQSNLGQSFNPILRPSFGMIPT